MTDSPIPGWLGLLIAATVFLVMLSLGLMLGREQFEAALRRRVLLIATLNKMPVAVVPAVFAYTLGAALVVTTFVVWQGKRAARPAGAP